MNILARLSKLETGAKEPRLWRMDDEEMQILGESGLTHEQALELLEIEERKVDK